MRSAQGGDDAGAARAVLRGSRGRGTIGMEGLFAGHRRQRWPQAIVTRAVGSPKRVNRFDGQEKLSEYKQKRDFRNAGARGPAARPAAERPRFVVQEHHARSLHWDLRLERDGVLVSWAVPKGIPTDPKRNHLAVHVEDHPLDYIDFAGEIPAGRVRRRQGEDLGQRHLRDAQVPRGRGDRHLPRRAPARASTRCSRPRARTG